MDIGAIQDALRAEHIDGWLLYDFRGVNPVASRLTGLAGSGHIATRRWYYLIPATGQPRALVHAIERYNLDHLPGRTHNYSRRDTLATGLDEMPGFLVNAPCWAWGFPLR